MLVCRSNTTPDWAMTTPCFGLNLTSRKSHISLSGLGTLRLDIVAQLAASLESCKTLHQKNEHDPNCAKTALGAQYITSLQLGIRHFEKLPMSRKQQKFEFAQQQRSLLEFLAMTRFISTYMDRMNSPVVDRNVVEHPCPGASERYNCCTPIVLYEVVNN